MKCRSCGAEILMVRMPSGRSAPVDKLPSPAGTICAMLDRETGEHTAWMARDADKSLRYTSHFATCPDANKWRKVESK